MKTILQHWNTREVLDNAHPLNESSHAIGGACPWCQNKVLIGVNFWERHEDGNLSDVWAEYRRCLLCGWSWWQRTFRDMSPTTSIYSLKEFGEHELNDASIPMMELGTFIRHRFAELSELTWQRFEDLTTDIFREQGFEVVQTARSHDQGADALLISKNNKIEAIVECKKHANGRPLSVNLVRELVGSCVHWDVNEAYLVTSTIFSSFSQKAAEHYKPRGYKLHLKDASEMLSMMSVYNAQMPALHALTGSERTETVAANRKEYEDKDADEIVNEIHSSRLMSELEQKGYYAIEPGKFSLK